MAQVKGDPMPPTGEMLKAIKERAGKRFNCSYCVGTGRVMVGALRSDACPECKGTGCTDASVSDIAAFAQAERETAERETLEACAKQMCLKCGAGQKVERRLSGNWYHNDFVCFAGPIHALARGDSFIDWNECHVKTREHWAEKILGLIGGASAVDVKGLADEIVDWLNDNGAELTRTQLRQGVADLLRKHIAASSEARDDPRCKRCGYIRSLHSIEPPYDLDGPHGFYCPSFSYVDPPKAGSGWWKKNRKVYCTCGHFGENHDPEDGNCEVGPPCEKKCQRFDARDLQPLETGTGAGEQEEK